MKLSKKGEYALRALIDLSLNYEKGIVKIRDIAKREKIPEKFLEQILLSLKKAGLLESKRGARGGYYLSKPPKAITLGEIIRIMDGPLAPLRCVSKMAYMNCPEEGNCGLQSVMLDVRNAIAKILDNITFDDVCKRTRGRLEQKPNALTYNI